jgi:hypothetical protein
MILRQTILPLELTDQNKAIVDGMYGITLEVSWPGSSGSRSVKQLKFYANPQAQTGF